jgi:hypothetical protein
MGIDEFDVEIATTLRKSPLTRKAQASGRNHRAERVRRAPRCSGAVELVR